MIKTKTIKISVLLFFISLNIGPFFMISCTEMDGKIRNENIFNRCCPAGMLSLTHTPEHADKLTNYLSHCSCSVNLSSSEYISPADLNSFTATCCIFTGGSLTASNDHNCSTAYTSEFPPVSINIVDAEVLLI